MKKITEQISLIINETELNVCIDNLKNNPNILHGDVIVLDAVERFHYIRDIIIKSIYNGTFDDISFVRRTAILSNLNSLRQYRNNHSAAINTIETLYDNLAMSGIFLKQISKNDYENEIKNIRKVKKVYDEIVIKIKDIENIYDDVLNYASKIDEYKESLSLKHEEIEDLRIACGDHSIEVQNILNNSKELLEKVKVNELDVDKRKLAIGIFSENIEEYKSKIQELEIRAIEIINKDTIISRLIRDAENALRLKSAQGISAAFASQYDIANNKIINRSWLIAAGIFVFVALILTVWIVGGWWINTENGGYISSIIGRVVAIGISLTGATFCSNQYVRQKNIAEDYAYKATLSKSIIAFSEEIKEKSCDQVAEYLIKVLDEIHKDPLRKRSADIEKENRNNLFDSVEKILKIFKENNQ